MFVFTNAVWIENETDFAPGGTVIGELTGAAELLEATFIALPLGPAGPDKVIVTVIF